MPAAHRPRRPELSQHFLRRGTLADRLVEQASIGPNDLVVEIGAGSGILTQALARRASRVLAVETDAELARELRGRFGAESNVAVVEADFRSIALPSASVRVVGNIPFALTSEIVRRTIAHPYVVDAYLLMQREAALRFAGPPSADESLWSLLHGPWWHVEIVRQLRRTDFVPPPNVDCVYVWFARRAPPLVPDSEPEHYERFIESAFGRARSAHGALAARFTPAQRRRLLDYLRIDGGTAPSRVRFDQWLGLYRFWRWQTG